MKDKPFQAAAILTSVSYTKDGGVRLGFTTNELTEADKVDVSKYFQQFGFVLFKPNEFSTDDIPAESAEDQSKTPSKRLRSVLFILWKQLGSKGDFDAYYRDQVEKLIEHIKAKLD